RTAADLRTERVIRRGGALSCAADRVHESAWRDREAEPFAKQRRDFGEGQAELFVQHTGRSRYRTRARGVERRADLPGTAWRAAWVAGARRTPDSGVAAVPHSVRGSVAGFGDGRSGRTALGLRPGRRGRRRGVPLENGAA